MIKRKKATKVVAEEKRYWIEEWARKMGKRIALNKKSNAERSKLKIRWDAVYDRMRDIDGGETENIEELKEWKKILKDYLIQMGK